VQQPTILIVSDDAEFSHAITARWKFERVVPAFTLMSGDLCPGLDSEGFDVAVVGGLTQETLAPVVKTLEATGKPVLLIHGAGSHGAKKTSSRSRLMTLETDGNWLDTVVLLLNECLIGTQAKAKIQRLEKASTQLTKEATLGRYMLETRHNLNNALTSVLGNSELLLLEPETLAPLEPKVRAQIDTIRNMTLRIHEIMQRFSSLEKEMTVAEKQEATEGRAKGRAASASN
jgi:signal transduction histidine kinase